MQSLFLPSGGENLKKPAIDSLHKVLLVQSINMEFQINFKDVYISTGWFDCFKTFYIAQVPKKTKLRGFGPRANYADRATAACW
jgi:hypothetical protein